MAPTTFSYKNYLKPTPVNLQYLTEGIQGLLVAAASSNMVTGDPTVSFWMMIGVYVTGKVSKFFGRVAHDREEITIQVPGANADEVNVTRQSIPDDRAQ